MQAASGPVQGVGRRPAPAADPAAVAFNALPRIDQKVLRRTVRMGRPLATTEEARMAVAFARFQRSQPWYKLFWVLFMPGAVVSMVVASTLHLAMVGVVLAVAAQGAWAWISLRRVERVNRNLLTDAA
ncbi:MAG: hypothetical protein AVDCRST_MAG76-1714 [uncultured Acidimicrobiales bacterium]|uniref:Transmembrane protein n=1 Tax=uncultured Acidimicrobiales bacterium TaxID=310071 RepID=A0A6J4I4A9_9ACTN|nr:MAG: hypothetical protein AVDCRST_MAG76-1714 [uncultured Acidimicrobiales bacterium]